MLGMTEIPSFCKRYLYETNMDAMKWTLRLEYIKTSSSDEKYLKANVKLQRLFQTCNLSPKNLTRVKDKYRDNISDMFLKLSSQDKPHRGHGRKYKNTFFVYLNEVWKLMNDDTRYYWIAFVAKISHGNI